VVRARVDSGAEPMQDLRPKTMLFCAVLALAIALGAVLRGRRGIRWLFAAFAADIALWYASQSLAGFFRPDIWERVTGVLTVLLPQFAIHLFQNIVPMEVPSTRTRLARFAAVAAVPVVVMTVSPYHDRPFALGAVYTYVFGLLAAALITLERRGRGSPSRQVRDRVRFLVFVGASATTFSMADFLSYLGVHLPPIGAVLAIVFLFVLAESVTRPRLADIYELAGRLLVSTALAFSLAAIFYLFVMVIGGFDTMYLNAVLAAIVFLVLFEPLQTEVETRIHQFFFRERYDLETIVADLRKQLAHVLEIDEMSGTLMRGLDRSRRVTTAAFYLRDQDGDGFDLVGSIGAAVPKRVEALGARPLLDRLGKHGSLSLEEMAREDHPQAGILAAAETLGSLRSAVVLAVGGDEDECVGLLFVADDRVRDAFSPEEITLFETVAAQIAVVVSNSRVYSRMKERDRLAALGSMAAGLAHEVKNPLGAIKGAAQLLEEVGAATPDDPAAREFVGIILEEVNRLDRVVGSFLDYARPHAGNPIPLDLNAAVRRTVQILSSQITDDAIDVKLDLVEPLPRTSIDPEKFRQVLMNLIQNAIHAIDGEGTITVSTSVRRSLRGRMAHEGAAAMRRSGTDEVELVEVSVRDTGPGISPKVLRNLFVPFFTTKTQGTGLGLAISQAIVQNAGGSIDVHSQPGAGTTFTIVLPGSRDALAATANGGAGASLLST
jgi:two-component system, NtrC family, sensor histidine kinase HydH